MFKTLLVDAREITPDGRLLFVTCGMRSFAAGLLSVVLGLYLAQLGFQPAVIGGIFAATLAGSTVLTMLLATVADRLGRKRVLLLAAVLTSLAVVIFALTDNLVLLTAAAIVGAITPSSRDSGPFLAIEQAILPQTVRHEHRTGLFAAYNLVRWGCGGLGALAAGLPKLLGLAALDGYRVLIGVYAAITLLQTGVIRRLSRRIEPAVEPTAGRVWFGIHRSRGVVARLAPLLALDSFGGGFVVESLVAYWFNLRYGADVRILGVILFGTNLTSALSQLAAPPLARRFGLLRAMVFSHLPANVLLILVPLMPTLELSVAMLLARHLFGQLDVPTRQSYVMAIVAPDERSGTVGLTTFVRSAAASAAPVFAGAALSAPIVGLPFLLAGGLKIVYDLGMLVTFRKVRPPEELHAPRAHRAAQPKSMT